MVGWGGGTITNSYATGNVAHPYSASNRTGSGRVGGLVGTFDGGTITTSYATGKVTGHLVGGLIGTMDGSAGGPGPISITASYWDTQTSGVSNSAGGEGKTTQELQSPTSNTGIYASWDPDVWDFGTSSQYPVLRGLGISPDEQHQSHPSADLTDRQILEILYRDTDGDNWTNNTNWLSDRPLSEWRGVTTNADGRVTVLNLPVNQLSGRIPAQLGNLSNLQRLRLYDNQLTGSIPTELGNLSNLTHLYLNNNQIGGSIPTELGNLSNLQQLHLNHNQLTGSIPTELSNLSNLRVLSLRNNQLSGCIPEGLRNVRSNDISQLGLPFCSPLVALYNATNGANWRNNTHWLSDRPIGEWYGVTTDANGRVTELSLNENRLSGSIPAELGNLSHLQHLGLSLNQLSGSIPAELGNLSNLQHLYLNHNQLSGSIPAELGNLSNLQYFWLWPANGLTGCIPTGLRRVPNNDLSKLGLPFCGP